MKVAGEDLGNGFEGSNVLGEMVLSKTPFPSIFKHEDLNEAFNEFTKENVYLKGISFLKEISLIEKKKSGLPTRLRNEIINFSKAVEIANRTKQDMLIHPNREDPGETPLEHLLRDDETLERIAAEMF